MSPSSPKNALTRLQRQVKNPEARTITWDRARKPTIERLDLSDAQAVAYIVETVLHLTLGHFVDALQQRGAWFDVYGIYRDGLGWYVKIGEDEDGCLVLSHHEPEFGPMQTRACGVIHPVEPASPER